MLAIKTKDKYLYLATCQLSPSSLDTNIIPLAKCKTAVSPVLMHWRYRSLVLSQRYLMKHSIINSLAPEQIWLPIAAINSNSNSNLTSLMQKRLQSIVYTVRPSCNKPSSINLLNVRFWSVFSQTLRSNQTGNYHWFPLWLGARQVPNL